jgi:hypothetical protein
MLGFDLTIQLQLLANPLIPPPTVRDLICFSIFRLCRRWAITIYSFHAVNPGCFNALSHLIGRTAGAGDGWLAIVRVSGEVESDTLEASY